MTKRAVCGVLIASASVILATTSSSALAQETDEPESSAITSSTFAGLAARGIGPAVTSGRVVDIAVNPDDSSEFYIAAASSGVWKTTNAGTTFSPVFDHEGSYSIGCVAIDPSNPKIVWVGTGENNSQRSVGFGDGVYKSVDGGVSWTNTGLHDSQHIGMIAIDPRDSNIVYVAAQGPLWNAGGDRGLYKTTNAGGTWTRVLNVSENTGVSEVHMDPRDPDTLYAVAYQRRRRVWTLIDGGPESAVYKSTDAGQSWRKIDSGLPDVDLGRIGLAVSPVNPDVLYAIVEAADGKSGFFRSTDRGETWEKRSDYATTSPQYYNEIFCDPADVDRVYAMDTYLHLTTDGGKTMVALPMGDRHVDNHALWIDPGDPRHMLIGCDGGAYVSFDRTKTWRFFENLPITQFYKAAVDNSEPFYFVYGGTQDNSTLGGPIGTIDRVGVANEHWFVTVGGDGFQPAVDPEDPNTVYSEWQYGGLVRHDRKSGEIVDIKPRQAPGQKPYVFNWDSPLIVSPHLHTRLYFAGRRLFQSDDRGNSWRIISGDLTRGIDRNSLKIMGKIQSVDAVARHNSTSIYGNAVAISESPITEGLLYVGSDDGLIHVTDNDGKSWRKIEVFPSVPDRTYVSSVFASRHDASVVYASFDNHKNGDFKPYLLRSDDQGATWTSIAGDLPDRNIVYAIEQDTKDPDLLFVGAEFGAYFTRDGGKHWFKIAGLPTIAVRDVEIQPRENDLVMATFGRGFYILDDFTPLRNAADEALDQDATIFPVRTAKAYIQTSRLGMPSGRGFSGSSYYAAPNPPFGALIAYRLKDTIKTLKEQRQKAEKKGPIEQPTVKAMRAELNQLKPKIMVVIHDDAGEVVRRLDAPLTKGLHRVAWDLRYPTYTPTRLHKSAESPWEPSDAGPLALAGVYTAMLTKVADGQTTALAGPIQFNVTPLNLATFSAKDRKSVLAFQLKVGRLQRAVRGAVRASGEAGKRIRYIRQAILDTPGASQSLLVRVKTLRSKLDEINRMLTGDPTLRRLNDPAPPSIMSRVENIVGDQWWVTSPPTQTQRDQYGYAGDAFSGVLRDLRALMTDDLPSLETDLQRAGAPWTPGRIPDWKPE